MSAEKWMGWARKEVGEREVPGPKSNQRIMQYREIAGIKIGGEDSVVPWCKIFVNAAFVEAGLPIEANAMALSIKHDEDFVELDGPSYGCVVAFWRGSPKSGTGHIGFYLGESADGRRIRVLGGNQGDMVKEAWFPKSSKTFGLAGYFWPESEPDPEGGRIVLDDDGEPMASAV
jgi:uncharacterized protein (TIGR02594 family)